MVRGFVEIGRDIGRSGLDLNAGVGIDQGQPAPCSATVNGQDRALCQMRHGDTFIIPIARKKDPNATKAAENLDFGLKAKKLVDKWYYKGMIFEMGRGIT